MYGSLPNLLVRPECEGASAVSLDEPHTFASAMAKKLQKSYAKARAAKHRRFGKRDGYTEK
jgi:hypothetical protein